MNCDELQPMMDAHLDSELDPRTTLEIQAHLSACPRCASGFARAERFERHLGSMLRRGEATPDLWTAVERSLAPGSAPEIPASLTAPRPGQREPETPDPWWRFWLWPSPKAYAVLATVWLVLYAVEIRSRPAPNAREFPPMMVITREIPSASQRLVLAHQHELRAELLDEPAAPTRPAHPDSPQSRWQPAGLLKTT